mmetsp:Transcript_7748/g.22019  ORF Transcript_7748/g.22019 Transcript_7748/m.22019 type:complete len:220 (-) Transcript_7748:372-1031(-)
MAVPMREVLMKVNMCDMPLWGVPMSSPTAPSKLISHVGLPWQPILLSMRPMVAPLSLSVRVPSSSTVNLGTAKSEMPLMPGGASGRRASTQWRMLSVKSCSPQLMKILVPEILYLPPSMGSALVATWARSEPQWGSVRHMVPVHSPETSLARYLDLTRSSPWAMRVLMAPLDRPGNMVQVQLAVAVISDWTRARDVGMPWPPNSSGKERPCQPPSTNWA